MLDELFITHLSKQWPNMANSELATNTAILKMLTQIKDGMHELKDGMVKGFKKMEERMDGYDEKIRILQDKIDDQPAKKKKGWDPNEKISCPECDGEFSASNLSKHINRDHPTRK